MAPTPNARPPSQRLAARPSPLRNISSGSQSSPLRHSWRDEVKDEEGQASGHASGSGTSGGQGAVGDGEYVGMTGVVKVEAFKDEHVDDVGKDRKFSLSSASPPSLSFTTALPSPPTGEEPDDDENAVNGLATPSKASIRQQASSMKETLAKRRAYIHHLPRAEKEALDTFTVLQENLFQYKSMGRSGQTEDMMFCDCSFDPVNDEPHMACGYHSNCINRLTQVECLQDECQTQGYCRNQRFARREYSDVQVIKTEKKGFGLRAGTDIETEAFIYEYIGEVVTQPSLEKRMQQYAKEGIPHFYFMMLQKEEYLDATKKGGIARFANHSCNPNCHVQKWVVGKRVRMGIFALRDIQEGEELTFNYNVDRYGHAAQTCHCEEPNCVGSIGGKTQTDIGGMDELYIEALGIVDEVAALEAKGTKRKKGRKLDEDFNPTLYPLDAGEVPKIVAALRQSTENRRMLLKLMDRVQMTVDPEVQSLLMRMHGFSLFTSILTQYPADRAVLLPALNTMTRWKPSVRNKIEDSKIAESVEKCLDPSYGEIAGLAQGLLNFWSSLETVWRIPRKIHVADTEDDVAAGLVEDTREVPASEAVGYTASWAVPPKSSFQLTHVAPIFRPREMTRPANIPHSVSHSALANSYVDRARLESILALAKMNQAEAITQPPVSTSNESPRKRSRLKEGLHDDRRKRSRGADDEQRGKRLLKIIGEFVVRTMSKYKDQMERETFKRYAKECTQVLVDKEKKGKSWQQGVPCEALSDDKKAKMKVFVKEYTHKILKKLKDKGKLLTPRQVEQRRASKTDSPLDSQPNSATSEGFDEENRLLQDMFGPDLGDDDEEEERSHTGSSRDRTEEELEVPELASSVDNPTSATPSQITPNTPPTPPNLMEKTFAAAISGY